MTKLITKCVLTIYGEVDPRPVDVVFIITIQEYNSTLIPPLITGSYIHNPDRCLLHKSNPVLVLRIYMRWISVKLDKYRNLYALLPPLDDVFNPLAIWIRYLTLQYFRASYGS